jgi:hypothetical protein
MVTKVVFEVDVETGVVQELTGVEQELQPRMKIPRLCFKIPLVSDDVKEVAPPTINFTIDTTDSSTVDESSVSSLGTQGDAVIVHSIFDFNDDEFERMVEDDYDEDDDDDGDYYDDETSNETSNETRTSKTKETTETNTTTKEATSKETETEMTDDTKTKEATETETETAETETSKETSKTKETTTETTKEATSKETEETEATEETETAETETSKETNETNETNTNTNEASKETTTTSTRRNLARMASVVSTANAKKRKAEAEAKKAKATTTTKPKAKGQGQGKAKVKAKKATTTTTKAAATTTTKTKKTKKTNKKKTTINLSPDELNKYASVVDYWITTTIHIMDEAEMTAPRQMWASRFLPLRESDPMLYAWYTCCGMLASPKSRDENVIIFMDLLVKNNFTPKGMRDMVAKEGSDVGVKARIAEFALGGFYNLTAKFIMDLYHDFEKRELWKAPLEDIQRQVNGVGSKISIILFEMWHPGQCPGIAVDIHVLTLGKSLGLFNYDCTNQDLVQQTLEAIIDQSKWPEVNRQFGSLFQFLHESRGKGKRLELLAAADKIGPEAFTMLQLFDRTKKLIGMGGLKTRISAMEACLSNEVSQCLSNEYNEYYGEGESV